MHRERIIFRLLCLSALVFAVAVGYALPAEAVTARSVSVSGLSSISEAEFLAIFGLRPGDMVDEEKVRSGIRRAFLKGIFENIEVEVGEGEEANVAILVTEKERIGRIRVSGDFAVSRKKIRELFPFREGEVLRRDLIEDAKRKLREGLGRLGYPDASVDLGARYSDRAFHTDLDLSVTTGDPLRILGFEVRGNGAAYLSDLRVREGDVFDMDRLEAAMQRLRSSMKRDGFFSPNVAFAEYRAGTVALVIETGRNLSIGIEGNRAVATKQLMKEVPFFEIELFNDEIVGEAVDRMVAKYHEEGYAFAQIAPVIEESTDRIEVTFFVFEGERVKVASIVTRGTSFTGDGLKKVMIHAEGGPYNPDILAQEREALINFYHALGFLEVSVAEIEAAIDRKAGAATLTVSVEEGEKTVIGSVSVAVAEAAIRERLLALARIKTGDPYNEVDIADARYRMLDYYRSLGYVHIDVLVRRTIAGHTADLVFEIVEGRKQYFGKTVITGNAATKYQVIMRELVHREGDPYSIRTIGETRQRLYKLGLFTDVDVETVESGTDRLDMLIRLKEGNAGTVEFGFGYAEYEQFRGFFEVSYRNLFGMNRTSMFRTEVSTLEKRLLAQYAEPWLFGYRLPFRAFVLYEDRKELTVPTRKVRYRLRRYSVNAGVEKNLSDRVKAELYYEFSLVETFDVQPDVVLTKEDEGTLAIGAIRPALVYDSRDNPFDPSEGILAGITLKIASPVLFSETDFFKATVYGSIFHRLHKRVVLAAAVRGGVSFGFGETDELPLVERFFLGGRSTVRGYEQDTLGPKGADGNPTGGNVFFMGNLELRVNIGRGFALVPFFDFGNVWLKAKDFSPGDLKYTAGLGLRYATPVGPLRVDYGFKLNRDRGESGSEIHFSIGHAF